MAEDHVLNTPSRSVQFRKELLLVKPFRLEQLGPFITASRTTIGRIAMIAALPENAGALDVGAIVLDLLEQDGTDIAAALAVAVEREPKWIAGGDLHEVAELIEAVAGLNKDFFARRLRTMVAAIREAISPPEPQTLSST